jgi:hypothetical protein
MECHVVALLCPTPAGVVVAATVAILAAQNLAGVDAGLRQSQRPAALAADTSAGRRAGVPFRHVGCHIYLPPPDPSSSTGSKIS